MNAVAPILPPALTHDAKFTKLAREVAMDIQPLEVILKNCAVPAAEWELISTAPRFQQLLAQAIQEWNSATNTADRVKVKALAFVEESLPEFFSRIHSDREPLSSKVSVLTTVAKIAGVGQQEQTTTPGEKVTITINMGSDTLTVEKELPPRVTTIEHEPAPETPFAAQLSALAAEHNRDLG